MNIVEPILFQARNRPSELALAAPGTPLNLVSYGRLAGMLSKVAHRLQLSNLHEGDRVVLDINDPLLRAILAIALARLGVVILTADSRDYAWPMEVTAFISSDSDASSGRRIAVDHDWVLGDPADKNHTRYGAVEPSSLCCVFADGMPTSAETNCFGLSHGLLSDRIAIQDTFFGSSFAAAPRLFTSENCATSLGFQLLIATLSRGSALFLIGDQVSSFSALNTYQVESAILSPKSLFELVAFYDARAKSPCPLNNVFAVSRLPKADAERASQTLGANVSLGYYTTYLGMVASLPCQNFDRPDNAVGFLLPGITCDDSHKEKNGKLRFRSEFSAEIVGGDQQPGHDATGSHANEHGYLTDDGVVVLEG